MHGLGIHGAVTMTMSYNYVWERSCLTRSDGDIHQTTTWGEEEVFLRVGATGCA
jgi:hypothetical protein